MNRVPNRSPFIATRQRAVLSVCAAIVAFAAVAPFSNTVHGQSRNTEHTLTLDDPGLQPTASFDDIDWMVGSWEGEGFGGTFDED